MANANCGLQTKNFLFEKKLVTRKEKVVKKNASERKNKYKMNIVCGFDC